MKFEQLKVEQLKLAADEFGVTLPEGANKPQVIAALVTDGVTPEMYEAAFVVPEEKVLDTVEVTPVTVPAPVGATAFVPRKPTVLLKMTRENGTFEVRGYKFTRDNPYLPVDEDAANYILGNVEGFHIASPKDAADFYA